MSQSTAIFNYTWHTSNICHCFKQNALKFNSAPAYDELKSYDKNVAEIVDVSV